MDQIKLPSLFCQRDVRVLDVLNHLLHRTRLGVDAGALINARQKSRLPVLRAAGRQTAAGPQRNKSRHVLVFGAQPINDPRTQARLGQAQRTGVHHHRRDFMRRNVGVHRADDGHVIHMLADVRETLR